MKSIIKGQAAVLVSMLAAFAITLTACGGGSSSSSAGGGTSLNTARVTGSVANGVATLEFGEPTRLLAAVSDMFVPVARADSASEVTVMCPGVAPSAGPVTNGSFSVEITLPDANAADCEILVDGRSGGTVTVQNGSTTTIIVVVDDGNPPIVTASAPAPSNPANPNAIAAGDVTSSDDDSIASTDSVDDDSIASVDDDSSEESEDPDSEDSADDDSSDATDNV